MHELGSLASRWVATIGVVGTGLIAYAALRGIQTLEAGKERDDAHAAEAAANARLAAANTRTAALNEINRNLQQQIDIGNATLAALHASVERMRVSELEAKAAAAAADAKRRDSDALAKK